MNTRDENRLRSFESIEGVMIDAKDTLEKYPLVKSTWEDISKMLIDLGTIAVAQGTDFSGVTDDKNAAKYEMARLAAKIAGCGTSYAKKTNNLQLDAKLNISKAQIMRSKQERAESKAKTILTECEPYTEELKEVMVTPELLEMLRKSIARYHRLRNTRGSTNSMSKVTTKKVNDLVKSISKALEDHLDQYVNMLEDDEPMLYGNYYAARNIRDLGQRHRKDNGNPPEEPEA